ncbi:MAG: hypothetical protein L6367_11230 [Cellulomonas sp.]|nr:hypothetical protein [Cellulomonas sp.]
MRKQPLIAGTAGAVSMLLLAACGSGSSTAASSASGSSGPLADCPSTVVIQTDWYPEPEHGGLYAAIDQSKATIDAKKGYYSGPLLADPNITLEIRAGGPFVGYQDDTSLIYQDSDILLGYVNTDEQVKLSDTQPTIAVMAPLAKSPQILMWDPEKYDFTSFADIGQSDATVLYFQGASYVDWMVDEGWLTTEQLDSGYDGSPTRFVSGENLVQQGFVTSEPYQYENELDAWNKPVSYLMIADAGFEGYSQPLVGIPEVVEENSACLSELIPALQQAQADFINDPVATNAAITDYLVEIDQFWQISAERAANAVELMTSLEIVADGTDGVLGSFDEDRQQRNLELFTELYEAQDITVKSGLTTSDLYTNEFLDTSIHY